jgi:predicted metal-dependent peptidase
MARRRKGEVDPATANFHRAEGVLAGHPIFTGLMRHARRYRQERDNRCPADGWAVVDRNGVIHIHPTRRAEPEEWVYVLAHVLLHLALGHFRKQAKPREWNAACDCVVTRFLRDFKLGTAPYPVPYPEELPAATEEQWYRRFFEGPVPTGLQALGTAGPSNSDMVDPIVVRRGWQPTTTVDWPQIFGEGLSRAVQASLQVAAGYQASIAGGGETPLRKTSERARTWFLSSYPLLGAFVAAFRFIEDPALCNRMHISVGAVDEVSREIYLNPAAGLSEMQTRFVIAHEVLHVALRHGDRQQGRDPFLWNIACDFVINAWLLEMEVGEPPLLGVLYDGELKGLSAESVYDRIVTDIRRYRKLATLAGQGYCDIFQRPPAMAGDLADLDAFYRSCLAQGFAWHQQQGRGLLPAGLIEEIRALAQPPTPWDVQLAQWFDERFPPIEKRRSYARASRRQSATPDIPRPHWVVPPEAGEGRTFGVVLDTSGSMDRQLLAKALGSIASYSLARDVRAVRVVFCDAAAYDQGYMAPDAIAGKVRVKGRGGTVLQPGLDLLEKARDFPADGPILIITDGQCDVFRIRSDHALLIPAGARLPFVPKGKVFRLR